MSDTSDAIVAPDEQEVWRDIPSLGGLYQASSLGEVRSLPRRTTRGGMLKKHKNRQGYFVITPCVNGVITTRQVSHLVCEAFHGPKPADKDLVAHGDGNPQNNRPPNLRWATYIENEEDKRKHGRSAIGEKNPSSKLTESDVAAIRSADYSHYGSVVAAAKAYGCSKSLIHQIRKGDVWDDEGNERRRQRNRALKSS